jgi:hypothetical protein
MTLCISCFRIVKPLFPAAAVVEGPVVEHQIISRHQGPAADRACWFPYRRHINETLCTADAIRLRARAHLQSASTVLSARNAAWRQIAAVTGLG